ncbi:MULTISPECIES: hypothetical protein [unclassified Streptomyces]|uniref:hypothetical protein n=1 Tax=unclassified Streptomyces TaxID=2593676 RepID=UPI002E81EF26|nr:hypothetical protein [Streptomyces sp. NBC_00523]WUD01598.1 hypothetical protein OHS17_19015 [Streptomyces sp. NBC_00523]
MSETENPAADAGDGTADAAATGTPLVGAALVVAVTVIVLWLGLLAWLAFHTDATEVAWSRLLIVLGSVEAVAFAAIGALFGTTVQRQRVADLAARTEAAESRASANETAALNGHRLAAAVQASRAPGGGADTEQLSADGRSGRDPLLDMANRLFPD